MKRFSKNNFVVLKGKENGFFYDVPTSSVYKVSLEEADLAERIQNNETDIESYILFEKSLNELVGDKTVRVPNHIEAFSNRHLSKLTVLVSTTCNLKCKYCYASYGSYGSYNQEIMSASNALNYVDRLNEWFDRIDRIQFFGGEPLIGIDAIESICVRIDELVKKGEIKARPRYSMITNLTLVDNRTIDIINKYDIRLTVSLDGPEEINDKLRIYADGNGTFKNVKENIIKCRNQINAFEGTFTNVHEEYGWSVEDLKNYLSSEFKIDGNLIYICPAVSNGKTDFSPKSKIDSQLRADGVDVGNISCLYSLKPEYQCDLLCAAGYVMLALMPNGDLYPCHLYVLDRSYCMGTLDGMSFEEIKYNIEKVREKLDIVHKFNNQECLSCWARNICHICPAKLLLLNPAKKLRTECDRRRDEFRKNLAETLETAL